MIMSYFVVIVLMCAGGIQGFPNVEIVGGRDAELAEAPYAVSIHSDGSGYICSGSIVSENWVLTTANYVINDDDYSVSFGIIYQNSENAVKKTVCEKVIHPDFKETSFIHNVAVVKVDSSFDFGNSNVNKVSLPSNQIVLPKGKGTLTGWKRKQEDSTDSESATLQITEINIVDDTELTEPLIRVKPEEGKKICAPDLGGSLVINKIQYGIIDITSEDITDYEFIDNDNDFYNICFSIKSFINVKYYIKWINEIITK